MTERVEKTILITGSFLVALIVVYYFHFEAALGWVVLVSALLTGWGVFKYPANQRFEILGQLCLVGGAAGFLASLPKILGFWNPMLVEQIVLTLTAAFLLVVAIAWLMEKHSVVGWFTCFLAGALAGVLLYNRQERLGVALYLTIWIGIFTWIGPRWKKGELK